MNYRKARLKIEAVGPSKSGEEIVHYTTKNEDLHFDGNIDLIEKRKKYKVKSWSREEGRYAFVLEDQNIKLPVGTSVLRGPENWWKEKPDASVFKIEYEATCYLMDFYSQKPEIICQSETVVDRKGNCNYTYSNNVMKEKYEYITEGKKETVERLFTVLIPCLYSEESYRENNDYQLIERVIKITFENGTVHQFNGDFCCDELYSDIIMQWFLKKVFGVTCLFA